LFELGSLLERVIALSSWAFNDSMPQWLNDSMVTGWVLHLTREMPQLTIFHISLSINHLRHPQIPIAMRPL
jgi:hypothetical protein